MSSRIRLLLPLAALCFVPSIRANDLGYVKCAGNQDRVWVYDSLTSFDVAAKLRCGAPVEILSRINGFVKIRTESGVEGYVPDSALPDLPAAPDQAKQPLASAAAQSIAAAHRTATAMNPAPGSAKVAAPPTDLSAIAPAKPVTTAAPQSKAMSTTAPASDMAPPNASSPASKSAPSAPTNASAKVVSTRTRLKSTTAAQKKSQAPAASAAAAPGGPTVPAVPAPAAPARPAIETVSASPRDSAVVVSASATVAAKDDEDSDEYADTKPQNESADPACRLFFAAYGLAPSQYKWMAENRRKEFSGICPAPDIAHVDYVVLFTHDSDSYTYAMPVPVHTDRNGFSDFSPLMTADTALISTSELEKARCQYVWVFHVTRGAFDPARFSPRRKPQFVTYAKGSHASSRAIEDGLSYVGNRGTTR
jgi:hypothetical protein